MNGDYDAHLTGTVCRRLDSENGRVVKITDADWENTYDLRFWYTRDAKDVKPAEVGSKSAKQMLVLRDATIRDPPVKDW